MKKIILIITAVLFGVVVGYVIKCSTTEMETQGTVFEEKTISEHEEHTSEEHEHEHEHEHFVEIEGNTMKALTVQEVADLWEIDAEILLSEIIAEFELQGDYSVDTVLEEIRDAEYKFSPAMIKDFAEEIKSQNVI